MGGGARAPCAGGGGRHGGFLAAQVDAGSQARARLRRAFYQRQASTFLSEHSELYFFVAVEGRIGDWFKLAWLKDGEEQYIYAPQLAEISDEENRNLPNPGAKGFFYVPRVPNTFPNQRNTSGTGASR